MLEFSKTYEEARNEFKRICKERNGSLHTLKIEPKGSQGDDLEINIFLDGIQIQKMF
jgi:hypothetical protein